jgi:hypothetical protein
MPNMWETREVYTTATYLTDSACTLAAGFSPAPPPYMSYNDFDGECDYCHVRQKYNEVGVCICCGAPLR